MTIPERRTKLQADLQQAQLKAQQFTERAIFLSGAIAVLNDLEREGSSPDPLPSDILTPNKEN